MNHTTLRSAFVALLLIGFASTSLCQGLHWTSTTKGGPVGERTEDMWVISKKMKMVTRETGEALIVRLDKELLIMVDPNAKEYSEITFAELETMTKKAGGKMDAQMAEMKKQLAEMPEEQRKMVEQMMGNKMPGMAGGEGKLEVSKSGDTKKISGYSCTKYVVAQDGKEMMTIWATRDVAGFDALRKDWEAFSKRMMAMNPMTKHLGESFGRIDGFPIQTELGRGMTSTVMMIEKKAAPASDFEVPTGYKKVKAKWMEEMDKEEE
jgi:hypothetical protein